MNNLPGLTDNRKRNSTGLFSPSIMRIFLCGLVSICVALPPEKIFSACSSQAAHVPNVRSASAACATPAACACPCHPPNASRGVEVNLCSYSQPKKKEKKRNNNPNAKPPSQAAPEVTIDLTKAAWLARSDELTQTFAALILEFCNLPLDTTRLCINCVRKWKTHMKKKHPRALEEHNKAQRGKSSGLY